MKKFVTLTAAAALVASTAGVALAQEEPVAATGDVLGAGAAAVTGVGTGVVAAGAAGILLIAAAANRAGDDDGGSSSSSTTK